MRLKSEERRDFLRGVVDMGSNGIRFSVSDLSPSTARILPTLHVYRFDVSLYEAQFDPDTGTRIPIPSFVTESVIAAFLRFQIICKDLGVPENRIRVIATEATRTAINSSEFLNAIETATGLRVEMLEKEEEGRIGALGIASGFSDIEGLAMDLGGGSAQITWLISQSGNIRLSPKGSISFPYGAAALTRKLAELKEGKSKDEADQALAEFRHEMKANFFKAYNDLRLPHELVERARKKGGFPLYLSGGGFRGWGYLLLYVNQVHGRHYPISIINGFSADKSQFENVDVLKDIARTSRQIFRVSDRRRAQVPAVAFLVNVLAESLPHGIKEAHFCQGGVREGVLFQELLPSKRRLDPLEVVTARFAPPSADALHNLLLATIPSPSKTGARRFPESINSHVLRAYVQVLYVHATMSKESSSTAALYSTSTGLMSSTHGVSHSDRARLALLLEERYHGELPPREVDFKFSLRALLTAEEIWWTTYLGKVGILLGRMYPAGVIDEMKPRVVLSSEWANHLGKKKNKHGLELTLSIQKVKRDPTRMKEALEDHVGIIEKVGKRKNWIGGEDGWGMAVHVKVVEEDIL
ncbi:Ppx-GppA-domain-containing protein [Lepidopterella palustris CBS 459.81]|uniref:Ppx-GppA-domain-containing protein n=1 Tax=Lepidopterella palustris CBS 459.81 TaxID=1314670 RepID=A0A8E2DWT4_9PEZI|nr:Ppx-GppA-domain-containing protein [Lepidopterella palustris CBS 459.81]